ncbi:MAG TPA: FHA domain-containing protein [Kofleriaceae bacterium]
MFKLVIQDDEGKTTVVPLIRDEITIGRKEGNTIRLTERNVSRRHARIMRNNGEVQIEDLGSYNGIRVNNARIAERVALRVSDQVQIGDYKLYLKAEGEQQVDEARTMPLERVDGEGSSNGSPTMPLGVPAAAAQAAIAAANGAAPANGLASAQLIGNPNRTQVAIADTDPAGRPVATAAAVAALTQTTGYGKLVVLSSNFAGKEFELSRPQMIVGRTDENDIVVNHRSISRNHAKVTREPDTGRYTISDLQSSNGVRVNGQDYSKVELRRGDVVDLGHVRLRFIEPGEDFLFSRDAVITDVPDAGGGGKRGMIIAVLLGILVLGGVGVFVLRGGDKTNGKGSDNNGNGVAVRDSGAATSNTPPGPGSDDVKVADLQPDASTQVAVNTPPVEDVAAKCDALRSAYKWNELRDCAQGLPDKAAIADLTKLATEEAKAEFTKDDVKKLAAAGKFKDAKATLAKIGDKSVYRREASDDYDNKITAAEDDLKAKVQTASNDHKCSDVKGLIRDAKAAGVPTTDAEGISCSAAQVATNPVEPKNPVENKQPKNPVEPKNVTPTPPKNPPVESTHEPACDPAASRSKGEDFLNNGMDTAALSQFESSLKCKADTQVMKMAYIASCRLKNQPKAKAYFIKLGSQGSLVQVCMRFGIDPAQ